MRIFALSESYGQAGGKCKERKAIICLKFGVFTNLLEDLYCISSSNDCFGNICIKVKIQEIKLCHKSKIL